MIYNSFCKEIEASAQLQIDNLKALPFAKAIAIMPDCHAGYGMPIGGVLATHNVIIPNAVGVDIGCGMRAFKTPIKELDKDTLKIIMGRIREEIPVGMKHRDVGLPNEVAECFNILECNSIPMPVINREFSKLKYQIGTLGGGNHFIELQCGADGNIWIMLHSGSRNLGKQICEHYNKLAQTINKQYYSVIDDNFDLAFFPIDSAEGASYIKEMQYAMQFAYNNRRVMMNIIIQIIQEVTSKNWGNIFDCNYQIDVHHNYAEMENHFGQNVMVHRKGAVRARAGETVIIPGSQGTCSYICEGLGNKLSLDSCSHGAGRAMSRKKAQNQLNLENEIKLLNDKGIIHNIRSVKDLDEAAGAYKNIDEVMSQQTDCVKIIEKLEPIAVIKG